MSMCYANANLHQELDKFVKEYFQIRHFKNILYLVETKWNFRILLCVKKSRVSASAWWSGGSGFQVVTNILKVTHLGLVLEDWTKEASIACLLYRFSACVGRSCPDSVGAALIQQTLAGLKMWHHRVHLEEKHCWITTSIDVTAGLWGLTYPQSLTSINLISFNQIVNITIKLTRYEAQT